MEDGGHKEGPPIELALLVCDTCDRAYASARFLVRGAEQFAVFSGADSSCPEERSRAAQFEPFRRCFFTDIPRFRPVVRPGSPLRKSWARE
jgi:hypothetical protein